MPKELSEHQAECLRKYFDLVEKHPHLFRERSRRKLILDKALIEEFCSTKQSLGVIAETPFFLFVNDMVSMDGGDPHAYARVIGKKSLDGAEGVVVIPVIQNESLGRVGDLILVEQERHSFGEMMIEFPRGFAEPGKSATEQALEELSSETGYVGEPISIGRSYTDSGASNSVVNYVLVSVNNQGKAKPEKTEYMERVLTYSLEEIWSGIEKDNIKDGFTIQGLAFYERHLLKTK